ncbi:MAG: Asp-tRNA(Asn)/Glu-tRNA(Gln) amidotransferase GatCAB subunit B, partial [Candidatus Melainabacteria bacterium]|nr:Asp-tRNA(Asn)/Glu-tRNA(Gln) amidotransferase GatCAB subunit B [Candidatus Melainabacteria bacterium]
QWIDTIAQTLPELPDSRRKTYIEKLGLSYDDANVLTESKHLSDFFERVIQLETPAKAAANWLMGPTTAYLKENKLEISQSYVTPENIRDIAQSVESGALSSTTAKQVLLEVLQHGGQVSTIIQEQGLLQISDEAGLKDMVVKVLTDNPTQLDSYRAGKTKLRQFFFGETMKATKGKANPQIINKILDELLDTNL